MEKEELLKQLELLADSCMSNYALESNGYNRGVLDALDLVNKYFALSPVINCVAVPKWLTDEIRALAKQRWNEHKITDDKKRVEAILIIKDSAEAAGYKIGISKAMELLKQHCL